jgi:hypothetical protein
MVVADLVANLVATRSAILLSLLTIIDALRAITGQVASFRGDGAGARASA